MTFDEARAALIQQHLAATEQIHKLVTSSTSITNNEWRELMEARKTESLAAQDLFNLNQAERDAKEAWAKFNRERRYE